MKSTSAKALFAALALAGGLALATAAAHETKPAAPTSHAAHGAGHTPSMHLHQIMKDGSNETMPMTGDVDRDFATMMTMHHEQAIEMVDVLLAHGDDEALKAMARKMKAAQQAEIAELAKHK